VKQVLVGAALAATLFATLFATPATPAPVKNDGESIATFAGGCFWCTESDFEKVPGVISAVSGYTGGRVAKPTYAQVSHGGTGHAESVQVRFDPAKVSYEQLLKVYWHSVDPTVKDRQFCDTGTQYRTAIFAHDAEQQRLAEATRAEVEKQLGVPVYTEVVAADTFYPAEDDHQDYYKKNPLRYKFYRANCGRDARLEQIWGPKKAK
jgi:peptide-methionine (S)-S-oxide reductase